MKIGLIGLGIMGKPMAKNILKGIERAARMPPSDHDGPAALA